ncbi:hypothetical protein M0654_22405 [Rhizobium sp. NTR19]|uniref:Uncharacterized protein n=1 Tax=Neorhizobium turbinariae TaxID=2937795 RepID=A0ABT0IXV5_9HYPH|nr:hypothetical protein [Neorhizobium turbinariae]MCK8782719.1 hypothetical protein [Neorhizobium turbinariae]
MNDLVPPPSSTGTLQYDMTLIGKTAVLSGRKQFGQENPAEKFYDHFLGDEEALCRYCIDAFFHDPHNTAGANIMRQAMSMAPADLSAAIVAYYRS